MLGVGHQICKVSVVGTDGLVGVIVRHDVNDVQWFVMPFFASILTGKQRDWNDAC